RWQRQREAVADHADSASGTSGTTAADTGVWHVIAQARLQHAHAGWDTHLSAGIGDSVYAPPMLAPRTDATCREYEGKCATIEKREIKERNLIYDFTLRWRNARSNILLDPLGIFGTRNHFTGAMDGPNHRERWHQHGNGEEHRPSPFER